MRCLPFSFTEYAVPAMQNTHVQIHSFYAQDQWTMNKVTLAGAVRYDHTASVFPQQTVGPSVFVPTAIAIPEATGTRYNDVTPRVAIVYDILGNGRTALKFNAGKYLAAADGSSITGGLTNPINLFQTNSGARTWTDANGNFRPDCNLSSMAAQDLRASGGDFCGAGLASFLNFNTPTTTYDPAILRGWGVRPYDWNFGVQVQQQVITRVSVDVGYFRRIFGNFTSTDNRAQNTFQQFQVTAPVDGRLPHGGGDCRDDRRSSAEPITSSRWPTISALRRGTGTVSRSTSRRAFARD